MKQIITTNSKQTTIINMDISILDNNNNSNKWCFINNLIKTKVVKKGVQSI